MSSNQNNPFETNLDMTPANHVALSPLSFIKRAAAVFPDHPSVIYGARRDTWSHSYARCLRLASALARRGIGVGDTIAIMAPNVPAMFEASFAIPMSGAVLNTLNVRLDAASISFMLEHGEAKVLLTDTEFAPVVGVALAGLGREIVVIDIDDPMAEGGERLGETEYEEFLASGDEHYQWQLPDDEWQTIALNYTSGTTDNPKGVVYHHRGAYLNALSNIIGWNMGHHPIYLWTLPMFHCNGWCYPWSLAAVAGTSVCTRKVDAKIIFDNIADHGVTHFCGAPIVLNLVLNAGAQDRRDFKHTVKVMTAAAPPPIAVLRGMEASGFDVTHVYGLTETYGPAVICAWKPEWDALPADERARLKSRQGVPYHALEDIAVMDPETMTPVPADGQSIGEVMFRGNIVMKGYLKNPQATRDALAGGWFHSGDLGVLHDDGYIQLKDRSKDIIISGGENISSIEIEDALYLHTAVMEAAVVARPDERWGETPCAFIKLRSDADTPSQEDIIAFCRKHMAPFKVPRTIVFGELPRTSTGKVQKFKLREQAAGLD
jgi:fatty-acyl-CoA synthase